MNTEKEKSYNEWLVINSQLGDRLAMHRLLERWYPRLLAYAHRRLGDSELARDVTQECMIGISRGLGRLQDPAIFPAWTYRLMERRCVDAIRSRVRERRKMASLKRECKDKPSVSEEAVDRLDQTLSVDKLLQNLNLDLAVVLKLYYQESLSVGEIATVLGIPAGTVKSRLYYARKMFAALLEKSK